MKIWVWLVDRLLQPTWVVLTDNEGQEEVGIRILGVNFLYYKWPEALVADPGEYKWRLPHKREFGESIYLPL